MASSIDPIAAVTQRDPYPYYADLVARTPLYRDASLGLWVAAGAEAVTAVLTSDLCRVRPLQEPVPRALLGSPAADIFRHLVRMNDGAGHCPLKRAVSAALDSISAEHVARQAAKWADALFADLRPDTDASRVMEFAFRLPVHVVGSLLGIADAELPQVAAWMSEFVRCIFSAGATVEQVERGKSAAAPLLARMRSLVSREDLPPAGLLTGLKREVSQLGRIDAAVIAANGIGFLTQSYEATAGLIGNTLVTLARQPDVRAQLSSGEIRLHEVIEEVLRYDPPTHNTRRFVAADGVVAGQAMRAGDAILVVVAAANRDSTANPDSQRFDARRKNRRVFTFGAGAHACPGEMLATAIAQAGVERLLAANLALESLAARVTYRTSGAARVPLFAPNAS